jgi:transcriptional regulator with XRE-family HTH domain
VRTRSRLASRHTSSSLTRGRRNSKRQPSLVKQATCQHWKHHEGLPADAVSKHVVRQMIAIDEKALAQHVGKCMRQARRSRKWKQAQVADAIGISTQFYGRIERGAGLPSMETFVDLLTLFELTPSAVLGGTSAPTASAAGDPPVLRRIARRLRRVPASVRALVRELLDELDRRRQPRG